MVVPARQTPLFDAQSEAGLYHDTSKFGFFSVLFQGEHGKTQRSYRLPLMGEVLRHLPKERDTWISQAEFALPNRRVVNLARLTSLFVDIDCYKENIGISPNSAEAMLLLHCEEERFPLPSLVIQSGRGIQVKWLLEQPLPRQALPRWNAAQKYLVERFSSLGADRAARDASRVLRLVDTVNSKSGEVVYVSFANRTLDGEIANYDFDYLCEYLLPYTRDELAQIREKIQKKEQPPALTLIHGNPSAKRGFSSRELAWHRLEDLRTLHRIRQGHDEGCSMPLLFWSLNFLLLSGATCSSLMFQEASALCKEFGFGEFSRRDELGALYAKAKEFEAGKKVIHDGRAYPALYTPKNDTLIEVFQITSDEQRQLKTIIGKEEANERHRSREELRRRKAGVLTRDSYLTANDLKRVEARKLAESGMPQRAIAMALGVSVGSVNAWIK